MGDIADFRQEKTEAIAISEIFAYRDERPALIAERDKWKRVAAEALAALLDERCDHCQARQCFDDSCNACAEDCPCRDCRMLEKWTFEGVTADEVNRLYGELHHADDSL